MNANTDYKNLPLVDAMARQRDRLFSRATSYVARGEYSALVTKEQGVQGVHWFIAIRKGTEVIARDIHYAGAEYARKRAVAMLDVHAPIVEVSNDDGNEIEPSQGSAQNQKLAADLLHWLSGGYITSDQYTFARGHACVERGDRLALTAIMNGSIRRGDVERARALAARISNHPW